MERKIGEEFTLDGIKLKVQGNGFGACKGCYFFKNRNSCHKDISIAGSCFKSHRSDKMDVIFIKVKEE